MSSYMKVFFIFLVAFLFPIPSEAAPQFTRSQAYGDWILKCAKDNNPKAKKSESCSLNQKLVNKNGANVMTINIIKIPKRAEKLAVFLMPLGFYIPDGAKITIDEGKPRRLLITYCVQNGCAAQISLDRRLSKELALGKTMNISLFTRDRAKKLNFAISLKGISAGLKAVK